MTNLTSAFIAPPELVPFTDPVTGRITPAWYRFLLTLYERTGGAFGPDNLQILGAIAEDQSNIGLAQQFWSMISDQQGNTSATAEQVLIAWALTSPSNAGISIDDLLPALAYTTEADPAPPDAALIAALAVATEQEQRSPAPEFAVTLGASPATYRAYVAGYLLISGGTVTQIEVTRDGGTTYYDTGLIAGQIILANGDIARITYAVIPTVKTFFPN